MTEGKCYVREDYGAARGHNVPPKKDGRWDTAYFPKEPHAPHNDAVRITESVDDATNMESGTPRCDNHEEKKKNLSNTPKSRGTQNCLRSIERPRHDA